MVSNGARTKIGASLAPPAAQATKSPAIDAALPRSSPDPVVFIIDDDVSVRESLHSLFRDIRLQSEMFGSATELLASKLLDAASCLVLDVRLPGMSGLDFQAELARANIDVPIVFMSGYADVSLAVRAMKAGAVDFLTKPFREQDMLDAVAIAIARDRTRRTDEKMVSRTRALFETLSPREREVMALVTSGLMNKQVAAQTSLAEATVKMHRGQVMRKMAAKSLVDLVKMAEYLGVQANNSQLRPSIEFKAAQKSVGRNTQSQSMNFTAPDFSYIRSAPIASVYPRTESRTGTWPAWLRPEPSRRRAARD
jgi:FixJ family two-component response regulator